MFFPSFLQALRGHCVVESKPEGNKPDLRLAQPWPELLEYCQSVDFEAQVGALLGSTGWSQVASDNSGENG